MGFYQFNRAKQLQFSCRVKWVLSEFRLERVKSTFLYTECAIFQPTIIANRDCVILNDIRIYINWLQIIYYKHKFSHYFGQWSDSLDNLSRRFLIVSIMTSKNGVVSVKLDIVKRSNSLTLPHATCSTFSAERLYAKENMPR